MIKVGFDAGHYLNTPGKRTPDGEREWNFNNTVAKAFANELALYDGVASKRFDDPTGKTDVSLQKRTDGANDWNADYYISFHHNALAGKWGNHGGVETYYSKGSTKGLALAKALHPAVVKAYGLKDRGLKDNNLHITRETKMPANLIEGGFMDSTIDIKKLRDNAVLENAGKLIAQAFAKYVGLKKTAANTQPQPTATLAETIKVQKGDTLYAIAKAHNMSVDDLKKLNGLTSDTIYVGKVLKLKAVGTNHIVKKGDTLYAIAKKYGTTIEKLQELNKMGKSTLLTVGKVLIVSK